MTSSRLPSVPCWAPRARGLSGSPHEPQGCAAPVGAENHPELDERACFCAVVFLTPPDGLRVASVSYFRVHQPRQI